MMRSQENSRTPSARLIVGLAVLLLSAGCGPGNGQGLDQDGNIPTQSNGGATGGGAGAGGASGNPNATFTWVRDTVFVPICSVCHFGPSAPQGVDWTASKICANVGRPSGEKAPLNEITSGDPATSYVIWKVQGAGPNGEPIAANTGQMPLGGTPLTAATIQNMRDWIADGVPGC
jgi:hypothetical protein